MIKSKLPPKVLPVLDKNEDGKYKLKFATGFECVVEKDMEPKYVPFDIKLPVNSQMLLELNGITIIEFKSYGENANFPDGYAAVGTISQLSGAVLKDPESKLSIPVSLKLCRQAFINYLRKVEVDLIVNEHTHEFEYKIANQDFIATLARRASMPVDKYLLRVLNIG